METLEKDLILDKKQILQKIKRIAFEIFENNLNEKSLIIAGIDQGGYTLARLLIKELKKISPFEVILVKIKLDKEGPLQGDVQLDCDISKLKNMSIILVDDVLYTGKTFIQSMKPFLEINVKQIQTVVLVNRNFTLFPIAANYTGYELSTTLNDHIEVNLSLDGFGVYLY
ncbi:phosphoribosyltransferase family protein [Bacteroidota bacterium]